MLASTYDTYDYITTHNGSPMLGYKGGAEFLNDIKDGSPVLPQQYAPFKECDIHPKLPGIDRGAERIIIGTDSPQPVWYTPDHYRTFVPFDPRTR